MKKSPPDEVLCLQCITIKGVKYVTLENAQAVIQEISFSESRRSERIAEQAVDSAWDPDSAKMHKYGPKLV